MARGVNGRLHCNFWAEVEGQTVLRRDVDDDGSSDGGVERPEQTAKVEKQRAVVDAWKNKDGLS